MALTAVPLQLYKRQTTQVPKVMDILWQLSPETLAIPILSFPASTLPTL
jgi:hypothetical protein